MAMINCPRCGREMPDTANVCGYCGFLLQAAQPAEPAVYGGEMPVNQIPAGNAGYGAPNFPAGNMGYGAPNYPAGNAGYGAPVFPAGNMGYGAPGFPPPPPPPPAKRKSKLPVLIGIIAGVAAIAAAVWFFVLPMMNIGVSSEENQNALFLDRDGVLYALFPDKEAKEIDDDVRGAAINRAGTRIAFVDGTDTLYDLEVSSSEATRVDDDVTEISGILADNFVLYTKESERESEGMTIDEMLREVDRYWESIGWEDMSAEEYYELMGMTVEVSDFESVRDFYEMITGETYGEEAPVTATLFYLYDFSSGETKEIFDSGSAGDYGGWLNWAQSRNQRQFAYINTEGDLILVSESGEETVISSVRGEEVAQIHGVPNEGDLVVWSVYDASGAAPASGDEGGDEFDVYAYLGGADEKVGAGRAYGGYCSVYYDASGKNALIDAGTGTLYSIDSEGINDEIRTGANEDGWLTLRFGGEENGWPPSLESFFAAVSADEGYDLYHINLDGDREKIASNLPTVWQTEVIGDTVYYLDEEGDLCTCTVTGGKAGESERIASDAAYFRVARDGSAVWFTRENGEFYDLYMAKDGESERIADEVRGSTPRISANGQAAIYFADEEDGVGELYLYRDGESERIASDVYIYSVIGYDRSFLDLSNIPYMGNAYTDDGVSMGDLYVYDGRESERLASDLLMQGFGSVVWQEESVPAAEAAGD